MKTLLALLLLIPSLSWGQELITLKKYIQENDMSDLEKRFYVTARCTAMMMIGAKITARTLKKNESEHFLKLHETYKELSTVLLTKTGNYYFIDKEIEEDQQESQKEIFIWPFIEELEKLYKEDMKYMYFTNGDITQEWIDENKICITIYSDASQVFND